MAIKISGGATISQWQKERLADWQGENGVKGNVTIGPAEAKGPAQRLDTDSTYDFFEVKDDTGSEWTVRIGRENNADENKHAAIAHAAGAIPFFGDALEIYGGFSELMSGGPKGSDEQQSSDKFAFRYLASGIAKMALSATVLPVRLALSAVEIGAAIKDIRDASIEQKNPVITVGQMHAGAP